ncbi:MAG: MFS transporter [Candidatus Levybacteria bacterium]|nr:MFS transporter [Candidatus Levybacteria bacterium]
MDSIKRVIHGNDIVKVLKIRAFLFLMISEFFTQLAFNMQHFVLIFIIYKLTGSNTAVSGIILSFTIPAVLFSLVSGVYVDRWNKKKVMFLTNFIRGVLVLPFLIADLHLGLIYALTFLIASATQFFLPAESAIIPLLVPKRLIMPAIAVFGLGIYATLLLGYILSGPFLLIFGQFNTILILAVLFFTGSFFTSLIRMKAKIKIAETEFNVPSSVSYEIKEIFSFIRRARKVMHALVVLTISQAVLFMFGVLGPGYMRKILDVQIESLSWILLAPAALGMGLGGLLLGSYGRKLKNRFLSTAGFSISGIVFVILPLLDRVSSADFIHGLNASLPKFMDVSILHIVVLLAFFAGLANSLIFIPSNATLQLETNERMRGRIYGFLNALIGAVSLLPVALAGGLADIIGVASVLTAVGIALVILSTIFFIFE